jgi:hypothetical protein
MEFKPVRKPPRDRDFWTYVTNGMSERRMPCETEPHGDPKYRIELLAYSGSKAEWVVKLLQSMAVYPFEYRSGFAPWHTIPVNAPQPRLWDGYLNHFGKTRSSIRWQLTLASEKTPFCRYLVYCSQSSTLASLKADRSFGNGFEIVGQIRSY